MKEGEMEQIVAFIDQAIMHAAGNNYLKQIHAEITKFVQGFPLPGDK